MSSASNILGDVVSVALSAVDVCDLAYNQTVESAAAPLSLLFKLCGHSG